MQQIPLKAVPNQTLSFNIDGAYWTVKVYAAITHMAADISRDGVDLIRGIRCFGGSFLLPYQYLCSPNFGNFIFDAFVDWENFGTSSFLYYMTAAEVKQYNSLLEEDMNRANYYAAD